MKFKKVFIVFVLSICLFRFLANPAQADSQIDADAISWSKTGGPSGAKMLDLAIDPENTNIIYAAAYPISTGTLDGGIYKSTNGGVSWERKIEGINDKETWSVTMDPDDNQILWAGTNSGEIYKTVNGGEDWELKKEASEDYGDEQSDTIYTIEIDPFDSNKILAGSRHGTVFKSENGGTNWETIYNESGLTLTGVVSDITYDPEAEGVVYLTSGFFDVWDLVGNGMYKSINGGLTWTRLENGLEEKTQFSDLVLDPQHHNVLYVANGMETNGDIVGEDSGYLYRSENAGAAWERIDIGLAVGGTPFTLNAVAIHPENSNRIYALGQDQRVLISEDRGVTWELIIDSGLIGIGTFVEYDPVDFSVMYATTYADGVFKSIDSGRTWEAINGKEIAFAYVEGFSADPNIAGKIYSQTFEAGFQYSQDYGSNWQQGHLSGNYNKWETFIEKPKIGPNIYVVSRGGGNIQKASSPDGVWSYVNIPDVEGENPWPNTLESSRETADLLYAGTRTGGIFKTTNAGSSWGAINSGLPENVDMRTITLDPNDENTIYAGSVDERENRLWKSVNAGNSWQPLAEEMTFTTIHAMDVDLNDESVIYAAPWGTGLFKSEDAGESWEEISGDDDSEEVFSLASVKVDPDDSDIIYAASRASASLSRSEDAGETWETFWSPGDEYFRLNSFVFDSDDSGTYYVAAWKMNRGNIEGDLFRHNAGDDDDEFEEITNGLPRAVLDVEIDPSDTDIIYASVHLYGLYKSTDRGDSWQQVLSFPQVGVNDLKFHEDGTIYAGTACGELPESLLLGMAQPSGDCGVYKSIDDGTTWRNLLSDNLKLTAVKQIVFKDDAAYIATDNGAYTSSNESTWQSLEVPFSETSLIFAGEDNLYVGTHGGGIYHKNSEEEDWHGDGPYANLLNMQIEVDPNNSDIVYASSFPGGVFKSLDGGLTWNEKNFALPSFRVSIPAKQAYYSLVINPRNPDNLFLGLFGKGVYISQDGAGTWSPINTGLDNKEVYNIQLDASGDVLYVGTNGGSVYSTQLEYVSDSDNNQEVDDSTEDYFEDLKLEFDSKDVKNKKTSKEEISLKFKNISGVKYYKLSQYSHFEKAKWKKIEKDIDLKIDSQKKGAQKFFFKFKDKNGEMSDTYEKKITFEPADYSIFNLPKRGHKGELMRQSGEKFSPNSTVALYFSGFWGGYYAPVYVKTDSAGSFSLDYKINKILGWYRWYAVDLKTKNKSEATSYFVY
jgi:photosystem II stability/assembly factor-like uncharacterized protein